MADTENEDLELQIEETPDAGAEVAVAEEPAKPSPEPDAIEALRAQIEAERQERGAAAERARVAEERARQFEREAQESRGQVQNGQRQQLDSAIELVRQQQGEVKRNLTQALQAGDYDKTAELQGMLAEQAAYLVALQQGKRSFEQQPRPQQQQQPRQQVDPVEAMARNIAASGSPRSADWLRAHPECATDDMLRGEMVAAHHRALKAGYKADSDDYFGFIERRLELSGAAEPVSAAAKPAAPARRAPIAAAPVSRDVPASNGAKQTIKVTRGQLEAGRMMGLTDKEIIDSAAKLAREGRLQ